MLENTRKIFQTTPEKANKIQNNHLLTKKYRPQAPLKVLQIKKYLTHAHTRLLLSLKLNAPLILQENPRKVFQTTPEKTNEMQHNHLHTQKGTYIKYHLKSYK